VNAPNSLWVDTFGDIFVVDTFNHRIRKIDRITSIITTFAGNGTSGVAEGNGIPATSARVSYPLDIQGDLLGNIFILQESVLRKINARGIILLLKTFYSTSVSGFYVNPMTHDVYFALSSEYSVLKVDMNMTTTTLVVGTGNSGPLNATITNPIQVSFGGISDVWVDTTGFLYIADSAN
jgi:hypothetical protein